MRDFFGRQAHSTEVASIQLAFTVLSVSSRLIQDRAHPMSERLRMCSAINIASARFGSSDGFRPRELPDFKLFATQASVICATIAGFWKPCLIMVARLAQPALVAWPEPVAVRKTPAAGLPIQAP